MFSLSSFEATPPQLVEMPEANMNVNNEVPVNFNSQSSGPSDTVAAIGAQQSMEPSQPSTSGTQKDGPSSKQTKTKKRSAEVLAEMKKTNEQMMAMQEQLVLLHKQIEDNQRRLQLQESANAQRITEQRAIAGSATSTRNESSVLTNDRQQPNEQANRPLWEANATTNQQAVGSSNLFASTQFLAAKERRLKK